ncbi:MAG: hypothetical protein OEL83_07010 [Desulforhopalus sp.]|nr:hypothetical protein [Desulforhopalus sp.]
MKKGFDLCNNLASGERVYIDYAPVEAGRAKDHQNMAYRKQKLK